MKIAVVCAPQTFGCNTGMYSVDLAAWYFLKKHFPEAQVTFATLYAHRCDFGESPFRYAPRHGDLQVLRDSDVILYWGDFLHALHYRNHVVSWLAAQGICATADQALDLVRRYLFLARSESDLLRKVVLYGGTLLFNRADSSSDGLYADDLERLMGSARGVWMREPFSAFTVSQLLGSAQGCLHGTDCAQLLEKDFIDRCVIAANRLPPTGRHRLGIFIGRSHLNAEQVAAFAAALGADLQLDLLWLDWGRPPFFLDRRTEFLERLPRAENGADRDVASTPLETLLSLQGFDVLVSDTYHVCVNAWNFGIPAVCLIDNSAPALPVNGGSSTIGRDKRVVFYWTYNAAPFLVYSSELSDDATLREKAAEIASLLNDRTMIVQIQRQMSQHARMSGASLARVLRA